MDISKLIRGSSSNIQLAINIVQIKIYMLKFRIIRNRWINHEVFCSCLDLAFFFCGNTQ